jgi:hypothetical protein
MSNQMTSRNSRVSHAGPRHKGQSVIEFVMMLFPFISISLLVVTFGTFCWALVSATNSVREGARYASMGCVPTIAPDTTSGCSVAEIQRLTANRSDGVVSDAQVGVLWCQDPSNAGQAKPRRRDRIIVSASRQYDLLFFPGSLPIQAQYEAVLDSSHSTGSLTVGACP